jgi:hypothetical protein
MLTIIGRAATLTKGTSVFAVIPDSGSGVQFHSDTPRYCYYHSECRKIIVDGTIELSFSTEYTAASTCGGDSNLPVCTFK